MKTPENVPDNNVGRKTPEEIKKGIANAVHVKYLSWPDENTGERRTLYGVAIGYVLRDEIFAYIQQLESDNEAKQKRVEKLEKDVFMLGKKLEKDLELFKFYADEKKKADATLDYAHAELLMLREDLREAKARLEQAERERDAAVSDLSNGCAYCKYVGLDFEDSPCEDCFQKDGKYPWSPMKRTKFEWRGACVENTKEESECR